MRSLATSLIPTVCLGDGSFHQKIFSDAMSARNRHTCDRTYVVIRRASYGWLRNDVAKQYQQHILQKNVERISCGAQIKELALERNPAYSSPSEKLLMK